LCETCTVAVLYPGLVIVAVNSDLRFILMAQGVAGHWCPLVVSTRAPDGSESMTQASSDPRVTVAQAASEAAAQANALRRVMRRRVDFMIAPNFR
jgi:hypothetical protein